MYFTDAFPDQAFEEDFRMTKATACAVRDALRFAELADDEGSIDIKNLFGDDIGLVATADMCILVLLFRLGNKGTWRRVESYFNVDRTKLNKVYTWTRRCLQAVRHSCFVAHVLPASTQSFMSASMMRL